MKRVNHFYLSTFIKILFLLLTMNTSYAHEPWLLTSNEMINLNQQAKPELFQGINIYNSMLLGFAIIVSLIWIYLSYYFKDSTFYLRITKKLTSLSIFTPLVLRLFTAAMLFISAFGLIPRKGISYFTPSILTPDLSLNLTPNWYFLKWLEIGVGVLLTLGVLNRTANALLIFICTCSLYLFGIKVFAYLGFYMGISVYLYMNGPGSPSLLKQPYTITPQQKNNSLLALQIFTGFSFIFSAIIYKFIQPNYDIAILEHNQVFSFGLGYPLFVFLMALVELFAGILIITGIGIRGLTVILFICFNYLSILFQENFFAHIFIYCILVTLLINGSGSWIKKPDSYFKM